MRRLTLLAAAVWCTIGSAEAACYCRFTTGDRLCSNASTAGACRKVDDRLKNATCRFLDGGCPYEPIRPHKG